MVSACDKKFTDAQYAALDAEIQNGGIEVFAEFLHALPLRYTNQEGERQAFTPHSKPLMTPIKRRMINLNRPRWEEFFEDWQHGDLGLPFITCAAKDVWAAYKLWCADTKTFSMNKKNFYASLGKRLSEYRTPCNIDGVSKNLRIFVVPYEWMTQARQERYTRPNTNQASRSGSEPVVTTAEYFGRQVLDFNAALRVKMPTHDSL